MESERNAFPEGIRKERIQPPECGNAATKSVT